MGTWTHMHTGTYNTAHTKKRARPRPFLYAWKTFTYVQVFRRLHTQMEYAVTSHKHIGRQIWSILLWQPISSPVLSMSCIILQVLKWVCCALWSYNWGILILLVTIYHSVPIYVFPDSYVESGLRLKSEVILKEKKSIVGSLMKQQGFNDKNVD